MRPKPEGGTADNLSPTLLSPVQRDSGQRAPELEYRGYDSAGLAWRDNGTIHCVRAFGNLDSLESELAAAAVGLA